MDNKIRVYFQYPWKYSGHSYYKYLIESPSRDIEYVNKKEDSGVIVGKNKFILSNKFKYAVKGILNYLKISFPNARLSPPGNYDLIHCAHCLSNNQDKPWVADFESEWQLYVGNKTKASRDKVKKILLRDNCKKIIAWTELAKQEILREFPNLEKKVEVVYSAVPLPNIKRRKHSGINLLFVGRYFYAKGGCEALEVIDHLTKKYENVYGIFISEVPKKILDIYKKNKKIKIYGLMPQKRLFNEIYNVSDILVYPGYGDTFGFAILEAMSFGIPIVTTNNSSKKELVGNDERGILIKPPVVKWMNGLPTFEDRKRFIQDLSNETELLVKNKLLRKKMTKNCLREVRTGKFSIIERNRKMERIYKEALKDLN